MPEAKPPTEEDELDELPPMDGESEGEQAEEGDLSNEELDEAPSDGGDPMDDSTGEGDPVDEMEISGSESGWLEDAAENEALDVGTPDTFGEEEGSSALLEGGEETDVGEEEFAFGGDGSEGTTVVGDAGEEGFEDEDEDLKEDDLPRIDAGDDAEVDDPDLSDALPDDDATEEPRPAWDDRAWERAEEGPVGIAAVDAVACDVDGIIVGGEGLARIDRAGRLTALEAVGLRGGAPRGIACGSGGAREWLVASTPRAGLLISSDGGKTFSEANGWRACVTRGVSSIGAGRSTVDDADGPLDIAVVGDEIWGRTRGGALVWSGDRGVTWASVLPDRRFEAIAPDSASHAVVALARDGASCTIARGAAGRLVLSSSGPLPVGVVAALAAHAGHVAVAIRGRGAFRLESAAWSRLEGTASLTALTFARGGSGDATLVIALFSEGEGRSWVLEARDGGPARTVAELGDTPRADGADTDDDEGDSSRVRALSWDEGRGVVWAAGGFGLIALRPARR